MTEPRGRCSGAPPWAAGNPSGYRLIKMMSTVAIGARCSVTDNGQIDIVHWFPDYFDAHGRDADPDAYRWVYDRSLSITADVVWALWELGATEGWFKGKV